MPRVVKSSITRKVVNTKLRGVDVDTSRFVYQEVPSIDGTRKILTIASAYVSGIIEVFRDGVNLKKTTDYAETDSTTITLVSALEADEDIWANYIKQG